MLQFLADKLSAFAARRQLDRGDRGNPFFLRDPKTQRAVQTLQAVGSFEDGVRAARYDVADVDGFERRRSG